MQVGKGNDANNSKNESKSLHVNVKFFKIYKEERSCTEMNTRLNMHLTSYHI